MTPEERETLKIVAKQVEQNNDILKSMRSKKRLGSFFKVFYWIAIIILGLYLWQLAQPMIESLTNTFSEISKTKEGVINSVLEVEESLKEATSFLDKIKVF